MDEGEQLDVRLGGDRGRLAHRRVAGLGGALGVLLGEAGVVDEQVGVGGGGDRLRRGRGVAADHDRAAVPARPHHLLGPHRPRRPLDLLPALQRRERRPFGDACGPGRTGVEPTGPRLLDQGVAVGAHLVARFEGLDLVPIVADRLAGRQLDQVETEAQPSDERLEVGEQVAQPRRPADPQRPLAVGQVVALQQPREAEDVVGVEVGEVDLVDLGQPQRALHLPLRPFAAVEQQPLPPARH